MTERHRQLAAIMFTDIQGYTAMMQQDEEQGLRMRTKHREIFNTTTTKYQGKVLQYYGDGTLSIFNSVIEALNCAAEMQALFQQAPPVPVRIGIHLGDIILAEDEVIGDAVNIAARLESIAVVGSVLISDRVQTEIKNHESIKSQSLGHFAFKNVQDPMEVFALVGESLVVPTARQMLNKGRREKNVSNNLPVPTTHFIGRSKELKQVKRLLDGHRLVTLLGPGGCGKTRLAIELARQSADQFSEGVWFVGLAPLTNPELIWETLAETFQVKPGKDKNIETALVEKISGKDLLLVLDNCEHLIDQCARISDFLLRQTEGPQLLATSREALNIQGEVAYRIPSLPFPDNKTKADQIVQFDSVQLFQDRVSLYKPEFVLNDDNSESVAAICQKLDGIPLAIEMAASRMKMMDAHTLSDRLTDQFKLLSSGTRTAPLHQKTMRATIDWSYQLLSADEKLLFHRLSIFSGNFNLEDAEKVCGYPPLEEIQVLDLLTGLVDKSLVNTVESKGTIRYMLLEVMKQYGLEKISQNEQWSELKERFGQYYLDMAVLAYKEKTRYGDKWSAWIISQLPNLYKALDLLQDQPDDRLKLASLLAEVFFMHAKIGTGHKILSTALAATSKRNVDRARALCGLGFLEILIDPQSGYQKMKEGIEIVQQSDDELAKVDIYWRFGSFIAAYKEWDEARKFLLEGLNIAQKLNDPWMELRYENNLAWLAINQMKLDLIEDKIENNITRAIQLGNTYDIIDAHHISADVAFLKEDYQLAAIRYAKAMEYALNSDSDLQVAVLLHSLAQAEAGKGRHAKGLRLYGASNEKLEALEAVIPDFDSVSARLKRTITKSREILGAELSQTLDQEGRQMGFDQAIEYAFAMDKD